MMLTWTLNVYDMSGERNQFACIRTPTGKKIFPQYKKGF